MKAAGGIVVLALWFLAACTRPVQTGVTSPGDDLDIHGDETGATDSHDTMGEIDVEQLDLPEVVSPSGNDLCGADDAQLPNEGDLCSAEGSSVCGKAEAVTKPTPWKPGGAKPPAWAADIPAETCWRPQILRCKKGSDGALRWVGEWCGEGYMELANDAIRKLSKKEFHCTSVDGQSSCCPRKTSLGYFSASRCDPVHRGYNLCSEGLCGLSSELPGMEASSKKALSAMPKDFAGCLMWFTREHCPGSECSVKQTDPKYDFPWVCKGFPGKCIQINNTTTTCDLSGCAGLDPPRQKGACAGLVLIPDAGGQPVDAGP